MGMNLLLQVRLPGHINENLNEAVEFSECLHALHRGTVGFVQLSDFLMTNPGLGIREAAKKTVSWPCVSINVFLISNSEREKERSLH